MDAPKTLRDRVPEVAQAGSIAGAIFAALVGADPFDIRNRAHVVQKLDYVAIALWVTAVVLFLVAAAALTWQEALRMRMLELALGTTAVAGAATAVALLLTGFGFSFDTDPVLLRTTAAEASAITAMCRDRPREAVVLYGSVRTSTLKESFLTFTFDDDDPEAKAVSNSKCNTVRVPTDAVLAVCEDPQVRGKSVICEGKSDRRRHDSTSTRSRAPSRAARSPPRSRPLPPL
jgi:hypothetical protein